MKQKMRLTGLMIALCCLLCGCDLWMDGDYSSVKPHYQQVYQSNQDQTEVDSYLGLRDALVDMVEIGQNSGVVYVNGVDQQLLDGYMVQAIRYLTEAHAIGSYAVQEVKYEIGTSSGRSAVSMEINYLHSRMELLQIMQVDRMLDAAPVITAALDACEPGVVLKVTTYEETDIVQLVQDYVDNNPQICMEMPQVGVNIYPERGLERVVELTFTYQTSRDTLRQMQETVQTVFNSAELYVKGSASDLQKYELLYTFLMERNDCVVQTSITPSYSLIHYGTGDSKAFANVYAAMCRQTGLDCQTVSGTKDGRMWHWNVVKLDGDYYYIDLLQCLDSGGFALHPRSSMGRYVWDYSAYHSEK